VLLDVLRDGANRLRRYWFQTSYSRHSEVILPPATDGTERWGAWGIVGARVGGPFALLIRRQTRMSRGVKDILVTGITATTLLTSVAPASAKNFFEALSGRRAPSSGPVPDANFTARDRQQLATPPSRRAWIPPAYRRQVVRYHRKEAPGTILVD